MSAPDNTVVSPKHNTGALCTICPHACRLTEGSRGRCRARRAHGGSVYGENYGRITSLALDPIEKKPLARFYPGSMILSVGSFGCNMHCAYCQNAAIAQMGKTQVRWEHMSPEHLCELAAALQSRGNIGVAYTYNEPLVGFEFVLDCARLIHKAGLKNVLVSNGFVNPGPLQELISYLDAANIDLKTFSPTFYRELGGELNAVRETIKTLAQSSTCHLEVTTLIIPGKNDSETEIDALSSWLADLDAEIPYHVSRFFPCHRMRDLPPTPIETVYRLAALARRHLTYVYTGNC